jgi:hypothetical protein
MGGGEAREAGRAGAGLDVVQAERDGLDAERPSLPTLLDQEGEILG